MKKSDERVPKISSQAQLIPENEEDEYESRINRTQCAEQYEALQECYLKTKDWRRCQSEAREFKLCFQQHLARITAEGEADFHDRKANRKKVD